MQGKTIYGYTLKSALGVGGMAEVWLAENSIGKKAAVKILLSKYCDDDNVTSRFSTEAKVMVALDHPNIRQVYDCGSIDGRPCIVMEYLEGEDLKTKIKRGKPFDDSELTKWWNQLVSALNYTHQQGIVHRDIKPGNIFVDTKGNIKLLDFGIAKVRESISNTQTGQKIGTLMYMSPEQVKDSKHIDYRTDIYSLAVTFVHLITGKKPYDSDTTSDFEISNKIVYSSLDLSEVPSRWRNRLSPYLNKEADQRPALELIGKNPVFSPLSPDDEETIVDYGGDSPSLDKDLENEKESTGLRSKGHKPLGNGRIKIIALCVALLIIGLVVLVVVYPKGSGEDLLCDTVAIDTVSMAEEQVVNSVDKTERSVTGFVDLGLPSGTRWKKENEVGGFYTYEEAMNKFGGRLPTHAQFKELTSKCQWSWTGSGYKVTGPNGNSIVLPAAGYRYCGGDVDGVGSDGGYWSSTPNGSDFAWSLGFDSGGVDMYDDYRCGGRSVRLVQD